MSTIISRLFYLSCELKPDLPSSQLLNMLGKSWSEVIYAASKYGLGGCTAALPEVSFQQLNSLYETGSDSGATPTVEEFRSMLAGAIYKKIKDSENISDIQQMKLSCDLYTWFNGKDSMSGEGELDFDAKLSIPPFTKTGFWPIDKIHGSRGVPQGVCTLLAKPGVGKTTSAIAIAKNWKEQQIGPVVFMQTELSAPMLCMKIEEMTITTPGLWQSGVDKLVFGRSVTKTMESLIDNPDPNRLVIFDSVVGHCGQGDTADSRAKFDDLYRTLCELKNASRMCIAVTHVKRGIDIANIEAAAGSSVVERLSDSMIYMSSSDIVRPDGKVTIKVEDLKNRWGRKVTPFKYLFDYTNGNAYPLGEDEGDELE